MYQKTQGVKTKEPFIIPAKGVIQEPQLGILTEPYTIGEKEYYILQQRYWVDWLNPLAYASLGIFIGKCFELFAIVYKFYKLSLESAIKLNDSQKDEIDSTIIILIISFIVFAFLLIINK